jgi:hypothetical protein
MGKIYWTDEERAELRRQMLPLFGNGVGRIDALRRAQEALPPDRRRTHLIKADADRILGNDLPETQTESKLRKTIREIVREEIERMLG